MCSKVANDYCRGVWSPAQKSSMEVFSFLSLSFFPSQKRGQVSLGSAGCFSIPLSFSHSSSAKTYSQVVSLPLYLGSCSCPWGRSLVPVPTWQLRDGHGVCLMCPRAAGAAAGPSPDDTYSTRIPGLGEHSSLPRGQLNLIFYGEGLCTLLACL